MRTKTSKSVYILAECGILLALSTVLGIVKLAELPYGGSITLASMLPLALIGYRHGTLWGIGSALVYGIIQQLLGLNNLSYFTSPLSIIAIILLDYIVAFAVIGLAGIFKKAIKNQGLSIAAGCLLACFLRYICHVISGCTVWAGISIPTAAAFLYSLVYNATYMIPETVIVVMAGYYLGDCIDFSQKLPKRIVRTPKPASDILRIIAGGTLLSGVIYDTVVIFSRIQNAETGEFDFTALSAMSDSGKALLIAISFGALLLFAILTVLSKKIRGKENA